MIFYSADLQISHCHPRQLKAKPDVKDLVFGKVYTDHMLRVSWNNGTWGKPRIIPFENLSLHPASKVLHYAQELFEGMKAYRGADNVIRLFRPMHNMIRMANTAHRSCLPDFDGAELLACIRQLVQIESEWVPHSESSSLYIRPYLIGTEPALGLASSSEAELICICSVSTF